MDGLVRPHACAESAASPGETNANCRFAVDILRPPPSDRVAGCNRLVDHFGTGPFYSYPMNYVGRVFLPAATAAKRVVKEQLASEPPGFGLATFGNDMGRNGVNAHLVLLRPILPQTLVALLRGPFRGQFSITNVREVGNGNPKEVCTRSGVTSKIWRAPGSGLNRARRHSTQDRPCGQQWLCHRAAV